MKYEVLKSSLIIAFTIFLNCTTGEKGESILAQTFRGTRFVSEGVNRISVDIKYDETISSTVKDIFTSSLRSKINLNKKLLAVDSSEKSNLILRIRLTGYSSEPVKFNMSGVVEERKLRIDSYVWLVSTSSGEDKIRGKKVESLQFYSDINPPIMSELKAITGLTDLLAERIVSVVTTGWYTDKNR